ncbi:D-alanyl-D-alanine carboxypeptidase/D-alanyl-D-alanine-endopeptidase [Namhaeicola litoreus]|uniref:D-alanyl-D-alanine carboxypeptidase/D-alanyl-D-alanine-endopeptidase n=1 Tax=Namhaeicola litoreus TaxID=1052145 RepID=A0ABW3Y543_9FLAO
MKSKTLKFFGIVGAIMFLSSCSVNKSLQKEVIEQSAKEEFFRGIVVYDPEKNKTLININGNKYFTPASNTKLFTFYAAYKTFKDSVPGLMVYENKDSLIISGTADPSLLYGFDESKTIPYLSSKSQNIYIVDKHIDEAFFGNGWAWNDYPYAYMVEKNLFPIYGNYVELSKKDTSITAVPHFLKKSVAIKDETDERRDYFTNEFYVKKDDVFKGRTIPFKTSNQLVADILGDTLKRKITLVPATFSKPMKPFYSVAYDTLYKQMLLISDNFIAEQLMLQVGKSWTGEYNVEKGIDTILTTYLKDLPQKPRWVDGSGLSRYNLFTPESIVVLLNKMYREIPTEKLFEFLPNGGESGTLKNYFKSEKPYIFAKTGTLSNNHSISGYLRTKRGKILIFSYMNNHYMGSSTDRKMEMEKVFKSLYENYK